MAGHRRSPARAPRAAMVAAAAFAGLLASGAAVWTSTQAAFSGTTSNGTNTWAAGQVRLSDDDGNGGNAASVMFDVSGLTPGQSGERCIVVTYDGDLAADVRLYATTSGPASLAPYLELTVESGTGGSFAGAGGGTDSCQGFSGIAAFSTTTPAASAGTLLAFGQAHTSFGAGVGSWGPAAGAPGQSRVYRFRYTLKDDNAAQGRSATATFTWEAQNV